MAPRLATLVSILLLNPFPLLYAAPIHNTKTNFPLSREKRQINWNDDDDLTIEQDAFTSNEKIIFEGLLGLTLFAFLFLMKIFLYRLQIRFEYMQSK